MCETLYKVAPNTRTEVCIDCFATYRRIDNYIKDEMNASMYMESGDMVSPSLLRKREDFNKTICSKCRRYTTAPYEIKDYEFCADCAKQIYAKTDK